MPDSIYSEIISKMLELRKVHFELAKVDIAKDPLMILCLSYQDGILHAFERMVANWHNGYYSHICNVNSAITSYFTWQKSFLKKKRYFDVAYIDGYVMGLFQLISEKSKEIGFPMYYVFNSPLDSFKSYQKISQKDKSIFNPIYRWAKKEAKKYKPGIVLQHTPFLMGASIEEF